MKKYNVLIYPAGTEIGLEIYNSLKYNLHFDIYGASGKSDHAKFIYPQHRYFEDDSLYISKQNFIEHFNTVLDHFDIDYIFPTHDSVALFLSCNSELINAKVICSSYRTTKISRSKKEIYKELYNYKFTPRTYYKFEEILNYPVFLKPDIGEGGKGTKIVYDQFELEKIYSRNIDYVVSEYLPGEEYTVDCFTNRNGELLFIGPRTRERITFGISFHSRNIYCSDEFKEIANTLNEKFNFRGSWFFQVKADGNGQLKLLEFSVRQASTMGLYRQLGVNFALLSLFDFIGYDVKVLFNDLNIELDRSFSNSYKIDYEYERVYVDLDDTLIVNGEVNTLLMRLIFQCINKKKDVILITKHIYNLDNTLRMYRINKELFAEIVLLSPDESKADHIKGNLKSIFIDNHFYERMSVKEKCKIPVFDVDAIECLIDASKI
ncbi:ATP-grasp domain-containing protein [Paucisalibacillus sp. EB02]|uniref:ATP-grasp domain-containing protein n=1 Tax=Paucisalibacillus sp. EB02 TaxID=1347087 RepID=UPI0004ADDDA7|nr:ATP-grasp domain-containing protein [Paucisalibacillus sp. EB02]